MRSRAAVGALLLLVCAACAGPAGGARAARTSSRPASPSAPAPAAPSTTETGSTDPAARTVRVVGLGDSVMAGTNCGCAGLAEEYGSALGSRDGDHVLVTNLGVGGTVTDDLLENLQGDTATRSAIAAANVVLVTIGANDLLPELDEWRSEGCDDACFSGPAARMGRNLTKILAAVDAVQAGHRATVLVTDYWNVFTDGDVARSTGGQAQVEWSADITAAANDQICAAARSAGDTCVDLVPVFKPSGADPTRLLASDGDHPNAAGVQAIVAALLAATPAQR
ncbi:SGNH/GDSL hydrolase family protein [Nocardioides pocheonensis]|uniref:SGNH/GDSL hydrolase family protein n=1 Tax=Nocardioides pocheonensis TaxID=661485 RepID=A0A3N0GQT4_9ACTN|nr:SGNH/GDSL hydrolase family protein [Nocardioides pocheonensis]